jgi:glycine betaine catabolism A
MVRKLLGESLIIVRDTEGVLRGFYNVCRHRGSRICDRDGQATSLVCPYHAWSYRLDGSVRSAPSISEDIDLGKLGLHSVPVREIGGVIVGSLKGDLQALDAVQRETEPM